MFVYLLPRNTISFSYSLFSVSVPVFVDELQRALFCTFAAMVPCAGSLGASFVFLRLFGLVMVNSSLVVYVFYK